MKEDHMNSEEIFSAALEYEKKNRDLYLSTDKIVDDERAKTIFKALADDEQGHIDFLEYGIDILKKRGEIEIEKLKTSIPAGKELEKRVGKMKKEIPERILGDLKRALSSALQLEVETTRFYQDAYEKSDGPIKEIFRKFLEIEKRHEEAVQIQLDHVSNSGYWFNFMEIDLEHG